MEYNSSSQLAKGMPKQFVINAKIVILCNDLPHGNNKSAKAMLSRTINHELRFKYREKLRVITRFVELNSSLNNQEREAVIKLLKENTNEATVDFNFRTMKKAIAFIKGNQREARMLFRATTDQDDTVEAYIRAEKEFPDNTSAQIDRFVELTSKKRRTFFYIKKKVRGR